MPPETGFNILSNIEALSVEREIEITAIELKTQNVAIVCMYRSSGRFENLLTVIETIFNSIKRKYIIICGDFNIDFTRVDTSKFRQIDSLLSSYGFQLTTKDPTRVATNILGQTSISCIDNIIHNLTHSFESEVIRIHISDYYAQRFSFNSLSRVDKVSYRISGPITQVGISAISDLLADNEWSFVLQQDNIELAFTSFFDHLYYVYKRAFPEKKCKLINNKPVIKWFTNELRVLSCFINIRTP